MERVGVGAQLGDLAAVLLDRGLDAGVGGVVERLVAAAAGVVGEADLEVAAGRARRCSRWRCRRSSRHWHRPRGPCCRPAAAPQPSSSALGARRSPLWGDAPVDAGRFPVGVRVPVRVVAPSAGATASAHDLGTLTARRRRSAAPVRTETRSLRSSPLRMRRGVPALRPAAWRPPDGAVAPAAARRRCSAACCWLAVRRRARRGRARPTADPSAPDTRPRPIPAARRRGTRPDGSTVGGKELHTRGVVVAAALPRCPRASTRRAGWWPTPAPGGARRPGPARPLLPGEHAEDADAAHPAARCSTRHRSSSAPPRTSASRAAGSAWSRAAATPSRCCSRR